jgi:hypothetical protein
MDKIRKTMLGVPYVCLCENEICCHFKVFLYHLTDYSQVIEYYIIELEYAQWRSCKYYISITEKKKKN